MAKKKDKPQVVNNIGELNLEIDYDKLAEAIVKAHNEAGSQLPEEKSCVSKGFASLLSWFFKCIMIVGISVLFIGCFTVIRYAKNDAVWSTAVNAISNVFALAVMGAILITLAVFCVVMGKASKEIKQEKDRNYIISVFSGIVSFAALIVALVALFKGVGQ